MLQGDNACHVETPEIQVHLLAGHCLRFHSNASFCLRRLLGFRRWASWPFQRLLSPPQNPLAWHRRYPYAYPPGYIKLLVALFSTYFPAWAYSFFWSFCLHEVKPEPFSLQVQYDYPLFFFLIIGLISCGIWIFVLYFLNFFRVSVIL